MNIPEYSAEEMISEWRKGYNDMCCEQVEAQEAYEAYVEEIYGPAR